MKKTLLTLTAVLTILATQTTFVNASEEVKVITYYPTPDTEYVQLTVSSSPRLAHQEGSVVIGAKNDDSLRGNGNMDVKGGMAVKSGILKPKNGLKLGVSGTDPVTAATEEGEMWVE
jgi:hypothetical protein